MDCTIIVSFLLAVSPYLTIYGNIVLICLYRYGRYYLILYKCNNTLITATSESFLITEDESPSLLTLSYPPDTLSVASPWDGSERPWFADGDRVGIIIGLPLAMVATSRDLVTTMNVSLWKFPRAFGGAGAALVSTIAT
jgi:hypothetical protein